MSGTVASRFQGRFGYAPGLRVGTYPGAGQPAPQTPATGTQAPSIAFMPTPGYTPSPLAQMAASTPAPQVTAGATPLDRRNAMDGAGSSEQAAYGGPGPTGMASTGDIGADAIGFGTAAGRASLGTIGSGVVGSALGVMASGLANALGFPETAQDIAQTIGLSGPITGYAEGQQNPAAYGEQSPGSTEGGAKADTANDPNTSVSYGSDFGMGGISGQDMGLGDYGPGANASDYGDFGGGSVGDSSNAESSPGSSEGGDKGDSAWMRGGYTGSGPDRVVQPTQPAGTVHEGEVVIPAAQVARYGLAPLMMLAQGKAAPSKLATLLRG